MVTITDPNKYILEISVESDKIATAMSLYHTHSITYAGDYFSLTQGRRMALTLYYLIQLCSIMYALNSIKQVPQIRGIMYWNLVSAL